MRKKGESFEEIAAQYLSRQGLKVLKRNYQCKGGEIDIIMHDRRYLIFVEVRYRAYNTYGSALESVTTTKQKRLIRAAKHYLTYQSNTEMPCRFDVIAIENRVQAENNQAPYDIHWIQNAFENNPW